mgnify:CR=1 FL=1
MAQERRINYSDKDFHKLRQDLITYAKSYFPDTYNDFSPTSPGMMFIEQAAYVGDVMSYYQDIQTQETFLQYAQEKSNLYNLAYMMGYRPKTVNLAEVDLDVYQRVPAKEVSSGYEPNLDYAMVISNLVVKSDNKDAVEFFINEPVDFTINNVASPVTTTIYSSQDGIIQEFLLKKTVKAYAGNIRETSFTIGAADAYHTLTIPKGSEEIAGILSVIDQNGDTWTEVPYLGQDTVFADKRNTNSDQQDVNYVIELKEVPRRFVTRYNTDGSLNMQFGSGTSNSDDQTFIPNPSRIGDSFYGGTKNLDLAYDPTNMLFGTGYGIAPHNTTLNVKYVTGVGIAGNVPSGLVSSVQSRSILFNNPLNTLNNVYWESTLAVSNASPAQGGRDGDTPEEIRQNAMAAFNAQKRAVTRADYTVRALSMPSKYGAIAKAYTAQEQLKSKADQTDSIIDSNPLALSLYVLAYDNDNKLVSATKSLKNNLKTYLSEYKMLSDAINIRDAFVVNIGVYYEIITLPEYNSREVLTRTQRVVQDFFDTNKWTINQPIELSKLYTAIDRVKGVQSAENIQITNKVDGAYSEISYDVNAAKRRNIIYPSYDPMIFEVKFPNTDIVGRVTNF